MAHQRRRLLLINYEFPPIGAGAGNATANIARCLVAAGVDVLVLTSRFGALPRYEGRDGYAIFRVPALRRRVDQCSPPIVVLEALAAGPPVIGTDVPGTRDLVEPGRNGFLVPPGSPGSIATTIDRFASSPELVRLLGRHGRDAALGRRWEGVADRYRQALGLAVRGRGRRPAGAGVQLGGATVGQGEHRRCPAQLSTG